MNKKHLVCFCHEIRTEKCSNGQYFFPVVESMGTTGYISLSYFKGPPP